MSSPIIPCLWFDNQAEEAADFYVQAFSQGGVTATSRYPESGDNPPGKPRGSVLTVEVEIAGQRLTLLNGGPVFTINPSISFFAHTDTAEQATALFERLSQGGKALMPLGSYPWSERYGWVQDRHGMTWQVMAGRRPPSGATIVPCLMFTGAVHGRAEEAMKRYTEILGGEIELVDRYTKEEGAEGTVKHARFMMAGQQMSAMDSGYNHGFGFNEGLSLQVMCEDQAEIDRLWAALTDGGSESRCGWLKDRFGVSWQVVPKNIAAWMTCPDPVARDRAFKAMMGMVKLDIATLEAALAGT